MGTRNKMCYILKNAGEKKDTQILLHLQKNEKHHPPYFFSNGQILFLKLENAGNFCFGFTINKILVLNIREGK